MDSRSFTTHQHANGQPSTRHSHFAHIKRRSHHTNTQTQGVPPLYRAPPSPPKRPSTTRDANGHTSTARSRRKSPRHRSNLKGRKSDSQLYGHHMSRGSYDPMNCTASCFVVGPHLMMVSETFPLHLFPLGLTTTEKVRPALSRHTGPRDSSPGTPCVPQLWERGERTRMRQRAREGFRLRASAVDHLAQRGEVATRMPRASRPRP